MSLKVNCDETEELSVSLSIFDILNYTIMICQTADIRNYTELAVRNRFEDKPAEVTHVNTSTC